MSWHCIDRRRPQSRCLGTDRHTKQLLECVCFIEITCITSLNETLYLIFIQKNCKFLLVFDYNDWLDYNNLYLINNRCGHMKGVAAAIHFSSSLLRSTNVDLECQPFVIKPCKISKFLIIHSHFWKLKFQKESIRC